MKNVEFGTRVNGDTLTLTRIAADGTTEQRIDIERPLIPFVCKQLLDAAGIPAEFGQPRPIPWATGDA